MSESFSFDVFLSHSSKDKAIVRAIAERLQADGLRVWLDDWEIRPGDSIPSKIEEGLEYSRVLVLFMSAQAFGFDWAQLESGTFRFRDPLNKERRFIPLRLDDAPLKGTLAQFLYIDWRQQDHEDAYLKLLEACRSRAKLSLEEIQATFKPVRGRVLQFDATTSFRDFAFSPDGRLALTGGNDHLVRLWDMDTQRCVRVFEGHTDKVWSVEWSADQRYAISGSSDRTVRLWDVETGHCLRVFHGHTRWVRDASLSADQRRILSAGGDDSVRLWDTETGRCLRLLTGHTSNARCVAWSTDQRLAVSGWASGGAGELPVQWFPG